MKRTLEQQYDSLVRNPCLPLVEGMKDVLEVVFAQTPSITLVTQLSKTLLTGLAALAQDGRNGQYDVTSENRLVDVLAIRASRWLDVERYLRFVSKALPDGRCTIASTLPVRF